MVCYVKESWVFKQKENETRCGRWSVWSKNVDLNAQEVSMHARMHKICLSQLGGSLVALSLWKVVSRDALFG